MDNGPHITDFSLELLCDILKYLPLKEILSVGMLCKKLFTAVDMHLRLCKSIDFCEDDLCGYMPSAVTDEHLLTLLKKCPLLETVYGLHPVRIERRRLRKRAALTIPGIIEALSLCFHLKAVETSDLRLLEAIMQHLPQLEIIGHFQNRDGIFPPQASHRLKLQPYPRISSLHLVGVEVPELTAMPHLQHLHLQCVRFTKLQPFRAFLAQNLRSFVMKHCIGPTVPQRYLSLIIALSSSPNLSHLELVRVPLLNGLFQRAVEDSYRHGGFINLRTLVIAGCKGVLEADLGHLMIVSSKNLQTLYIQPSLTKDSLFVSLAFAECSFPALRNLHLGYIDNLNPPGEWTNDALLSFGLAEVPDTPSSITDSGMKVICHLFPNIRTLSVSNCPHLMVMCQWMGEENGVIEDGNSWNELTDLTLQKCHCLQLPSFVLFLAYLPKIQVVVLNDMFREPPKGCSHVGLSAGTGLGMSSAVVSNQDEHIAVQGHHQEFEHPGDEENEENEREFIDMENEENPEPQFMVLQRDFFDGEEEEEDAVANPPVEGEQDPVVAEQAVGPENHENGNAVFNEINLPENSVKSPSFVSDESAHAAAVASENQKDITGSKYHLRNSNKKLPASKADNKRGDIFTDADCPSNAKRDKSVDEQLLPSNDVFKPGHVVQDTEISGSLHSSYVDDYDPHKPSTSKAGSHLDYKATCDTKAYDAADSDLDCDVEVRCDLGCKRLRKSFPPGTFTKKAKKSIKTSQDDFSDVSNLSSKQNVGNMSKINCPGSSENRSSTSSHIDSFDYPYNIIKPCKVVITKYEDSIPMHDASNNTSINCNFQSKAVKHSPAFVDMTTIADSSFSKNDHLAFVEMKPCYVHLERMKFQELEESKDLNLDKSHLVENVSFCTNSHSNELKSSNSASVLKNSCCSEITDTNTAKKEDCLKANNPLCKEDDLNRCDLNVINEIKPSLNDCRLKSNEIKIEKDPLINKNCSKMVDVSDNSMENICDSSEEIGKTATFKNKSHSFMSKASCSKTPDYSDKFKTKRETTKQNIPVDDIHIDVICCDNDFNLDINNEIDIKKPLCNEEVSYNSNYEPNSYFEVKTENSSKETQSKSRNELCKPSTSKVGADIPGKITKKHSKFIKKTPSQKCVKREVSSDASRNKPVNPVVKSDPLENDVKYMNSHVQSTKSISRRNRCINTLPDSDAKLSYETKKLKSEECQPDYNMQDEVEGSSYHILVPDSGSVEIVNAVNGESYTTPCCHVLVTHINNENDLDSTGKSESSLKKEAKSDVSDAGPSELRIEFNPYLPSTSRAGNNLNRISENTSQYNSIIYPESHRDNKDVKNRPSSDVVMIEEENLNEKISDKRLKNNSSKIKKCCFSQVKSSINEKERLKIKNSDAVCLIKECDTHPNSPCHLSSNDDGHLKYNSANCCKNLEVPSELKLGVNTVSETSCNENKACHKIDDVRSSDSSISHDHNVVKSISDGRKKRRKKFCTHIKCSKKINSNAGVNTTSETSCNENKACDKIDYVRSSDSSISHDHNIVKSISHGRKKRRKKFCTHTKCSKKINSNAASNSSCKDLMKNNCKRAPSVPMKCLISQGTQATSADIRRSVRRIRRAASQRRTVPPARISKSPYSNKISAKTLTKKPINMNPQPECHEKATSTSDPLLEDDAVQTLQVTSGSLLSFTVVSCGISDLFIDKCPKLYHIEAQACRILKNIQLKACPSLRRLNASQCPKLNICALAAAVMSLPTDSYFLVSYEPCMQGYHPGEGEKAILSRASINQSVLICHDFCDISSESIQADFREKILAWLLFMSRLNCFMNNVAGKSELNSEMNQLSEYPWSHNLRRKHGLYSYLQTPGFCEAELRYELLTNNPVFCDIFEAIQNDSEFPDVSDRKYLKDPSVLSDRAFEECFKMRNKFVAFYIPVTENN